MESNNELLYNQLYEKTKEFGRTHFIKEIMRLERDNKALRETLDNVVEQLKLQRKISLSLQNPYTISVIDTVLNEVRENELK